MGGGGKRCWVPWRALRSACSDWLKTMICGKKQANRLRNLGFGVMHCGIWVSGHGCLVLGVGYWVLGVGCWVLVWTSG